MCQQTETVWPFWEVVRDLIQLHCHFTDRCGSYNFLISNRGGRARALIRKSECARCRLKEFSGIFARLLSTYSALPLDN